MGPIEGKTYSAGYMAPAKTFGIEREDPLGRTAQLYPLRLGQGRRLY